MRCVSNDKVKSRFAIYTLNKLLFGEPGDNMYWFVCLNNIFLFYFLQQQSQTQAREYKEYMNK